MIAIIPMAGKGERFFNKGYLIPKPLISVDGMPMVIKAVLDLPKTTGQVFIVLKSHMEEYRVDEPIKAVLPEAQFVVLEHLTEGQASTCMFGLDLVDDNEDILISACDNGMIFDRKEFDLLKKEADVIVFSFRNNLTVVDKPSQYGWVRVFGKNKILDVSVKKPISNKPINDHAVVGAFWFRHKKIFKEATNKMIAEDRRINNEFYVDECINDAISLNYRVAVLEIDKYICWGTPSDYETYKYWSSFFKLQ